MHTEISGGDKCVEIRLHGRFTFQAHPAFAKACEQVIGHKAPEIRVNLSKIEVMDSAGLGMLLILRERAGQAGKSVLLTECSPVAAREIRLAMFQKLFPLVKRSDDITT